MTTSEARWTDAGRTLPSGTRDRRNRRDDLRGREVLWSLLSRVDYGKPISAWDGTEGVPQPACSPASRKSADHGRSHQLDRRDVRLRHNATSSLRKIDYVVSVTLCIGHHDTPWSGSCAASRRMRSVPSNSTPAKCQLNRLARPSVQQREQPARAERCRFHVGHAREASDRSSLSTE